MPLRGMGRINRIPGVPLRCVSAYARLAAPRKWLRPLQLREYTHRPSAEARVPCTRDRPDVSSSGSGTVSRTCIRDRGRPDLRPRPRVSNRLYCSPLPERENCKVRGPIHFSAKASRDSPVDAARKHGPDPFALDLAGLLSPRTDQLTIPPSGGRINGPHGQKPCGLVGRLAQLVRAPARQAGGHRFESRIAHSQVLKP
jgi:hypothetical protein